MAQGRTALVAFLTAGYPDEATFGDAVVAADASGCDVIEIGVPFSDPIADGPTIQVASAAALQNGMTLERALGLARELRPDVSADLVVMSYINPILNMGTARFADRAANSGVSGVILPDVSFEESDEIRRSFAVAELDYIDLIAPTSSDERVKRIASAAVGFIYLVSLTGVTGASGGPSGDLPAFVDSVRRHSRTPVYVGFGISTAEQAAEVARCADGVIIGSRLIRLLGEGSARETAGRVGEFLAGIRASLDGVTA